MKKSVLLTSTVFSAFLTTQSALAVSLTAEQYETLKSPQKKGTHDTIRIVPNVQIASETVRKEAKIIHITVKGDTLSKIAKRYKTTVKAVLKLNPSIRNPNLIKVGQKIHITGTPAAKPASPAKTKSPVQNASKSVQSTSADHLIAIANKYLGVSYKYGSSTSTYSSFDCSSFTYTVFKQAGVTLPRTSSSQARAGVSVSLSSLQKGDLVFFDTDFDGTINHVGIYAGGGRMIHASSSKGISYANVDRHYWAPRLEKAVRLL